MVPPPSRAVPAGGRVRAPVPFLVGQKASGVGHYLLGSPHPATIMPVMSLDAAEPLGSPDELTSGPQPIGQSRFDPGPGGLQSAQSGLDALTLIDETYAREHAVLPIRLDGGCIVVACPDPADSSLLAEVEVLARRPVRALRAPVDEILVAIGQRYSVLAGVDRHVREFSESGARQAGSPAATQLQGVTERSPVVEIVNLVIAQGLRDRASDIHIEPQQDRVRVRYRIDGLLKEAITLPKTMAAPLASRIKVMANMDIVDRHRAQDGQMRVEEEGRDVDVRVSTAETIWGEKVVMRLLDQGRVVLHLDELGLAQSGYETLRGLLRSPYGMVVVSGPTGSGKTTSLYAAIRELDPVSQNIMTIEDPVEYTFENINQIQIRKMANLTFANGLKAILRQDPDVILVGEIRDRETAEIAVQSALTGHLVLSSLHATDAAGVIQRFLEMGIEGFLISSALIGVAAQRLVRRICTSCVEEYQPPPEELELWLEHAGTRRPRRFVRGRGCGHCAGTGYRGRIGVFEVLAVDDRIKRLITSGGSSQQIRSAAVEAGMAPLRGDAMSKVEAGVTTLSEVIRCVWIN